MSDLALPLDDLSVSPAPYSEATAFFNAIFPRDGYVSFRTLFEGGRKGIPSNHIYEIGSDFASVVEQFLLWCELEERSAFVVPGLVRPHQGGCKDQDVIGMPAIVGDFDQGNTLKNLAAVEAILGPATAVVESGGHTGEAPKVHAWWRLSEVARGADIAKVCALQADIARKFQGDIHFGHPAQVIRIPSSWHRKGAPKIVRLRSVQPTATVSLADALNGIGVVNATPAAVNNNPTTPAKSVSNVVNFFDFNNVDLPGQSVERALSQPILAEGASADGMTRFEGAGKAIGHFIHLVREGTLPDLNTAWERVKQWNEVTLKPAWTEDRLRTDFDRLVSQDIQDKGPIVAVQPVVQAQATGRSIRDWSISRFKGPAPERRWLVEGLIPAGTPGVFAAVGDAGKSMLALRLAYIVGCYPAAQPGPEGAISAPRFFGCPVTARGAAVILTAEDDEAEVHRRLVALDAANLRDKTNNVFVVPMLANGGARSILVDGPAGPQQTQYWHELRAQLLDIPDLKLVVLDPLSSFVGLDTNDNTAMASLMTMVAELAATTGAAVMLVHHFAKSTKPTSLSDARTSIRGAAALVDNGRWALTLWEAGEDQAYKVLKALDQKYRSKEVGVVYFGGLTKGNAPSSKVLRILVRGSSGVLEDVTDVIIAASPRPEDLAEAVYRALRAERMADPTFAFATSRNPAWDACQPVLFKAGIEVSKDTLPAIIEQLKGAGRLVRCDRGKRWEPKID